MGFGNPLGVLSRNWVGGWSQLLEFSPAEYFDGLLQLEIVGGGALKLSWEEQPLADFMNVYIKPDTATGLFSSSNMLGKFSNVSTKLFIRTEADNQTLLQSTKIYYVGIRREIGSVEDSNTVSLFVRPLGGEPSFPNDRHIGLVL